MELKHAADLDAGMGGPLTIEAISKRVEAYVEESMEQAMLVLGSRNLALTERSLEFFRASVTFSVLSLIPLSGCACLNSFDWLLHRF